MSEQVQTGGVMQFQYPKQNNIQLDDERKNSIKAGYEEYDERKKKEKAHKIALFILLILIVIFFIIYMLIRN